jgi:hypothetical protein
VKAFEDHCGFFGDCFFGLEEGFFLRVIIVEAGCEVAVVHPSKVNKIWKWKKTMQNNKEEARSRRRSGNNHRLNRASHLPTLPN